VDFDEFTGRADGGSRLNSQLIAVFDLAAFHLVPFPHAQRKGMHFSIQKIVGQSNVERHGAATGH